MSKSLLKLEDSARMLDPSAVQRRAWTETVIRYAEEFLQGMDNIPVYTESTDRLQSLTDKTFEEHGTPIENLLEIIEKAIDRTGINPASQGHFGYVPGGGLYSTALGDFIAAVTNRYAGIFYANPGAVTMENLCIEWMIDLMGYPSKATGNLTSGGSIATLIAVTAARDHHGIEPHNVSTHCIYLSHQMHHCVIKALKITGLDHCQLRIVPMDEDFRMQPKALDRIIEEDKKANQVPFLICASAGSTDLGVIDPLKSISRIARQHNCWFHIDAAYGGFFKLVKSLKHLFEGIEDSDSIVLDPHKGLFLSYGSGAVLIKNRSAAINAHKYTANYMQDAYDNQEIPNPSDVSPELTKHFRGMRMWMSLQLHGLGPFRAALEEKIILTKYFYDRAKTSGFEMGPLPQLSVCLFRIQVEKTVDNNQLNQNLVKGILSSQKFFISSTTIKGVYWLRVCIMIFRTHKADIDRFLALIAHEKNKLLSRSND